MRMPIQPALAHNSRLRKWKHGHAHAHTHGRPSERGIYQRLFIFAYARHSCQLETFAWQITVDSNGLDAKRWRRGRSKTSGNLISTKNSFHHFSSGLFVRIKHVHWHGWWVWRTISAANHLLYNVVQRMADGEYVIRGNLIWIEIWLHFRPHANDTKATNASRNINFGSNFFCFVSIPFPAVADTLRVCVEIVIRIGYISTWRATAKGHARLQCAWINYDTKRKHLIFPTNLTDANRRHGHHPLFRLSLARIAFDAPAITQNPPSIAFNMEYTNSCTLAARCSCPQFISMRFHSVVTKIKNK